MTIRFIIFFIILTIYGQGTPFPDQIVSLADLRSSFILKNDRLISAKGETYFPYPFQSELHENLAFILKDLKQAKVIDDAYQKLISRISGLEETEKKAFITALLKVCLLFGNPKNPPQEAFLSALKHQGEGTQKWLTDHLSEVKLFIEEANTSVHPIITESEEGFTIVILTTSCSGGNLFVANALSEHFELNSDIKIIQIDTEELAKEIDPMMIATGIYTYEMIYSAIFQKTNDFSVIPGRKKLSREIHRYIPSDFLGILKEKVAQFNPDLIISTRSHLIDDLALTSLGVPFRMLQADFELCPSLHSYYREIPSEDVRFWLYTAEPSMFKSIFETYESLNLFNSQDSYNATMEKMSLFLQVPSQKLKERFEVIGYPVSSSFFQITNKELLKTLKKKWKVTEQEIPIFITMGKHGSAASKKIFKDLLHAETTQKLKYIFICGKNEELKKDLEQALYTVEPSLANRFAIYGLLSQEEMNEIMNICPLGISKAGAATVLEAMANQGYLLLMESYPWEVENGTKLVEMGCGLLFEPNEPLIKQIEKGIDFANNRSKCFIKLLHQLKNWRSNLTHKIDGLVRQKKFLHRVQKSLSQRADKDLLLLKSKDQNPQAEKKT